MGKTTYTFGPKVELHAQIDPEYSCVMLPMKPKKFKVIACDIIGRRMFTGTTDGKLDGENLHVYCLTNSPVFNLFDKRMVFLDTPKNRKAMALMLALRDALYRINRKYRLVKD